MEAYSRGSSAAFIRQTVADDEYIHVFGEIDVETDVDFRLAIAVASQTARRVVIDLSHCTYMGSQGFAVLANMRIVTNLMVIAPTKIKRLMGIVGLEGLCEDAPLGYSGMPTPLRIDA